MPAITERNILEHLRKRRQFCRALLELSREQRDFIVQRDYNGLLTIIGRKQRVIGRLEELKQEQPAIVSEWKSRRDELPDETRNDCEEVIRETETLLATLLREEQVCTEDLERSRDETSRELHELNSGREAHDAYGNGPVLTRNRYLDLQQ